MNNPRSGLPGDIFFHLFLWHPPRKLSPLSMMEGISMAVRMNLNFVLGRGRKSLLIEMHRIKSHRGRILYYLNIMWSGRIERMVVLYLNQLLCSMLRRGRITDRS